MKVDVYWITGAPGTPLGIMPRPRGGDWLEDEIHSLRSQGVDVIASMLTPREVDELDLSAEEATCRSLGIQFLSFPINDRSVPGCTPSALDFVRSLSDLRSNGKAITIHCRAGIGRSSMIAAAVLAVDGATPTAVWRMIYRARGCAVPDTVEQVAWVEQVSAAISDIQGCDSAPARVGNNLT